MKLKTIAIVAAIAVVSPAIALAQVSLPSFGSKAAPATGPDIGVQQDALVQGYVAADKDVLTANSKMLDALGLKGEAADAQKTADSLGSGATAGNLSDGDKVIGNESHAITDALAKKPQLDAAGKAKFSEGLGALGGGVLKYVALRQPVQDFGTGLKNASMLQVPKLRAGAYVVGAFPDGMKNLAGSLQNAVSFAKTNDIPVPANATSALSGAF